MPMARGPMARVRFQPPPRSRGRVTARDVPPVLFLLSRKVVCRQAPLDHPSDKQLLAQAGDWVDPRGSVVAVPTAHAGMGAWMRGDVWSGEAQPR